MPEPVVGGGASAPSPAIHGPFSDFDVSDYQAALLQYTNAMRPVATTIQQATNSNSIRIPNITGIKRPPVSKVYLPSIELTRTQWEQRLRDEYQDVANWIEVAEAADRFWDHQVRGGRPQLNHVNRRGQEVRYYAEPDGNFYIAFIEPIDTEKKEPSMLETLLKLYYMNMSTPGGVRSPMPHLFGPPGCGKSSVVHELAEAVGKKMHIINVSRISPLELEGVQMPNADNSALTMLTATFWTQLQEGDILLLDEFLRGFPEVYNGMLDIFTSRRVGSYTLPNVFIIGASNTVISYDSALEDRLMHLPVADPRQKKSTRADLATRIVDTLGLMPEMANSIQMSELLTTEVLPMYNILDKVGTRQVVSNQNTDGHSLRNLIGQVQLRHVQSSTMQELIMANNRDAISDHKYQYVVLLSGKGVAPEVIEALSKIENNKKLSELQRHNVKTNLQLIDMEAELTIKKENKEDEQLFSA